jgi:hypothetical protein
MATDLNKDRRGNERGSKGGPPFSRESEHKLDGCDARTTFDCWTVEREFHFKKEEAECAHELQKFQFEVNKEMLLFLRSLPPNPDEEGG